MRTLTQGQFSAIIERWNSSMFRAKRTQAADECKRAGHVYAITPLTSSTGRHVRVCTRCMKYVTEDKE